MKKIWTKLKNNPAVLVTLEVGSAIIELICMVFD